MANELKVAISFDFSKGGAEAIRSESLSIDVAGDSMTHGVQGIPTGGEVLLESDELGTAGWVYAKNLDGTNFVTIGSHATDNHAIKLLAGEACVFRAAGDVYGKADTAACNVEYIIVEL